MKCLSIHQPWASLVVAGATRYEVRGWQTAYRGPLAIHASRLFPLENRRLCRTQAIAALLKQLGYVLIADLPLQACLGTVHLHGCVRIDAENLEQLAPTDPRFSSGSFRAGQWAWQLRSPVVFAEPIPLAGWLKLFEVGELVPGRLPARHRRRGLGRLKRLWRYQRETDESDREDD